MRILVLDDERDLRDLYSENLAEAGHEVVTASNGAEGLGKLGWPPEMILVDLMMPVMDGYEFLDRLRRTPGHERTPALVVSAVATGGWSTHSGATAFIPKPFDADELLQLIEKHAA